jgi:glutathione S-transferase
MKLYGFPPSPNTWKVRAVAAQLGIKLDLEFVDLTKGGSRQPAFLALNPMGRTPALVDGDFKLSESTAIMHYLASQKPNSLWPNEPHVRAEIMRWECWSLAHWGKDACEPFIFENLVKAIVNMGPPDQAALAKGAESFKREASILDAHLAKQPYVVGKELTIADFSVAAPLFYAERAQFPLAPYAHIKDWFGRVSALPAWKDTAPQAPSAAAA